jgi:hypothetical protein
VPVVSFWTLIVTGPNPGGRVTEARPGDGVARRLFGDLVYRSAKLGEDLAGGGVLLAAEWADRRPALRQQVKVAFSSLKRTFGLNGTLAKTLVGLVTRIAAKATAYTYGLYVNRLLGRPQGRIKEVWAYILATLI